MILPCGATFSVDTTVIRRYCVPKAIRQAFQTRSLLLGTDAGDAIARDLTPEVNEAVNFPRYLKQKREEANFEQLALRTPRRRARDAQLPFSEKTSISDAFYAFRLTCKGVENCSDATTTFGADRVWL